jgi:hypothetical protein
MKRFWTYREWLELAEKEPRLNYLEDEIIRFRATKKKLGSYVLEDWYTRFKPQMCRLVGSEANNPKLSSEHAYSVAYHYLCDLLTDKKK